MEIPVNWLDMLQCPECQQAFRFEPGKMRRYGILVCPCNRYPVIDGIPVFMEHVSVFEGTMGGVLYHGPERAELIRLIEDGDCLDALLRSLALPMMFNNWELWRRPGVSALTSAWRRMRLSHWCMAPQESLTAEEWFDLFYRQRSPLSDLFSYFFYRFAQPRHLAALVLLNSLTVGSKPVLDLACGAGHIGYNLSEMGHQVVGADRNFFQLWVAQYSIAPRNHYVCADADRPLPFADNSFSATVCSDAFHYIKKKHLVLAEIARCAPNQPVILARVGNKLVNPNEGSELSPAEYLELCPGFRILGERELVARYLHREAPSQHDEKWLSLVSFAKTDSPLSWLHAMGSLGINPIYQVSRNNGHLNLRFQFPSEHYAVENEEMRTYHPAEVTLAPQTRQDIQSGYRSPEVQSLIEQMVVIGMPKDYRRPLA